MLLLTFHIGQDCYALEARRAVEVLPLVALTPLPGASHGVAGMFSYRGEPIVAVDLCQLILNRPARPALSTRIIVVDAAGPPPNPRRLVGLIVERATEILRCAERGLKFTDPGPGAPYLGPVLVNEGGLIRLLRPENLPRAALAEPPAAPPALTRGADAPASSAG